MKLTVLIVWLRMIIWGLLSIHKRILTFKIKYYLKIWVCDLWTRIILMHKMEENTLETDFSKALVIWRKKMFDSKILFVRDCKIEEKICFINWKTAFCTNDIHFLKWFCWVMMLQQRKKKVYWRGRNKKNFFLRIGENTLLGFHQWENSLYYRFLLFFKRLFFQWEKNLSSTENDKIEKENSSKCVAITLQLLNKKNASN